MEEGLQTHDMAADKLKRGRGKDWLPRPLILIWQGFAYCPVTCFLIA